MDNLKFLQQDTVQFCKMLKVGIRRQAGKRENYIQELVSETRVFPLSYLLRFVVIQWLVVGANTTWFCLQKRDVLLYNWFWLMVWKWKDVIFNCKLILLVWEHNFRSQNHIVWCFGRVLCQIPFLTQPQRDLFLLVELWHYNSGFQLLFFLCVCSETR